MMNHYIALTSLKGNKSKNGVLRFSCLENVQKGTCIVTEGFTPHQRNVLRCKMIK